MGGGDSQHSTRDMDCAGLWRDVVEENGTKMGPKWDQIPIFHSPIFPICRRSKIVPTIASVQIS